MFALFLLWHKGLQLKLSSHWKIQVNGVTPQMTLVWWLYRLKNDSQPRLIPSLQQHCCVTVLCMKQQYWLVNNYSPQNLFWKVFMEDFPSLAGLGGGSEKNKNAKNFLVFCFSWSQNLFLHFLYKKVIKSKYFYFQIKNVDQLY